MNPEYVMGSCVSLNNASSKLINHLVRLRLRRNTTVPAVDVKSEIDPGS